MDKNPDTYCPNCEKTFVHDEEFVWTFDENQHPTIEFLRCPHCGISTEPAFKCEYCPVQNKCEQEEECKCCGAVVKYDDFIDLDSQSLSTKGKE